ncbi:MAG: hypothetical protein Q8O67_33785 [Deltaproteobacteria bacterium]|nr:hypothetical protein [Deltaproteobacteria bacterium]
MRDPWAAPSTSPSSSAGAEVHDLEDDRGPRRAARNLLLLRLLLGSAALLSLSFAILVGSGAREHGIDRELYANWWSHHAEYDCCSTTSARCGPGVDALLELRERLIDRAGAPRERLATVVASGLGLADLDISHGPATAGEVHAFFVECPALRTPR